MYILHHACTVCVQLSFFCAFITVWAFRVCARVEMEGQNSVCTSFNVAHIFNDIKSLWLLDVNFASEVIMMLPIYIPSPSYTFSASIT